MHVSKQSNLTQGGVAGDGWRVNAADVGEENGQKAAA